MPNTDSKPASDKEQTQVPQIPPHSPTYRQQTENDTIDLYELWIILYDKKWLIIAITVISALGSVVYALRQPAVYKAEALLMPPRAIDIQSLNISGVAAVPVINPTSVFDEFKINLGSRKLQKKFILENGLMDQLAPERTPDTRDEDIYADYAELIKIANENESTSISMEWSDAETASKWVNDFVKFVDIETISLLVESIGDIIANQIRDIEYQISSKREMVKQRREDQIKEIEYTIASKRAMVQQRREDQIKQIEHTINSRQQMVKQRREDQIKEIEYTIASKRKLVKQRREDQIKKIEASISSKREMAKRRRQDQIIRFKEAIVIANVLGLKRRSDATNLFKSAQMNLDIITATNPIYYLGTESLKAEIQILENRTSDDPFIDGLRGLQEQLARLSSIKSDDPFISGLRDSQEQMIRLRSIKSDDPYISGLRDLQEKLARLRSIKSDDPFIDGLRGLQEKLALLRSIKFEEENLHAVSIDKASIPPKGIIKPSRRLVVSLGTVVGLFLGIFLAFFVEFVRKQKEIHLA